MTEKKLFQRFYIRDNKRNGVVLEKIGVNLGERMVVFATGKAFGYENDLFVCQYRERLAPNHHIAVINSNALEGKIVLHDASKGVEIKRLPVKSIHDVLLTDLGMRISREMLVREPSPTRVKICDFVYNLKAKVAGAIEKDFNEQTINAEAEQVVTEAKGIILSARNEIGDKMRLCLRKLFLISD